MATINQGGPAFPTTNNVCEEGLTVRDYFAAHAPPPPEWWVKQQMEMDRQDNPHNDSYKPRRRGQPEIECMWRFAYADMMIKCRTCEPRHGF